MLDGILADMGLGWERPPGSITAREVADDKGVPIGKARLYLRKGVAQGVLDCEKGPSGGCGAPCIYYYPKGAK